MFLNRKIPKVFKFGSVLVIPPKNKRQIDGIITSELYKNLRKKNNEVYRTDE